jgi:hypothetical protein
MEPLVVRGAWYGWRVPSLASSGCGGLLAFGSILALTYGRIPWSIEGSETVFSQAPLAGACVVVFAVAATYSLAKSFFRARAGRIIIDDDGVLFTGLIGETRVAWSELAGYSDSSGAHVDLAPRGLAIPTRDDATRAAVLAALDAHGLRRIEVSSRHRTMARAAIAGALAIGIFVAAVHIANRRYRRVDDLAAGSLPPTEVATAIDEVLEVRPIVRSPLGVDDSLRLEARYEVRPVPGFFVPKKTLTANVTTFIELEASVELDGKTSSGGASTLNVSIGSPTDILASIREAARMSTSGKHHLAVGRHEAFVVSRVWVGKSISREKTTRVSFEVVPGSVAASHVKLVPGPIPDVRVEVYKNGGVSIKYVNVRPPLAARVECFENGASLAEDSFIAGGTGTMFGLLQPHLGIGHHVLTFRFTPNVPFAYDADVAEIQGETFEREVTVDVR